MYCVVVEIDVQVIGEDDEGFVGVGVVVLDEVVFDFYQFELVVVYLGDYFGLLVVVEQGEFGGEVDCLGCVGGYWCVLVVGFWCQGRWLWSGWFWMIV